jgi:hypothetical protein
MEVRAIRLLVEDVWMLTSHLGNDVPRPLTPAKVNWGARLAMPGSFKPVVYR